jgi:hypothetical protein
MIMRLLRLVVSLAAVVPAIAAGAADGTASGQSAADGDTKAAVERLADQIRPTLPDGWSLATRDNTIRLERTKDMEIRGQSERGEPTAQSHHRYWLVLKLGPELTLPRYQQSFVDERSGWRQIARCQRWREGIESARQAHANAVPGQRLPAPPTAAEEQLCERRWQDAKRAYRPLPDLYFGNRGVFVSASTGASDSVADGAVRAEFKAFHAKLRGMMTESLPGRIDLADYARANIADFSLLVAAGPLDELVDPIARTSTLTPREGFVRLEVGKDAADGAISEPQALRIIEALAKAGILDEAVDLENPLRLAEDNQRYPPKLSDRRVNLSIRRPKVSDRWVELSFKTVDLGCDERTCQRLETLRAALEGSAARQMGEFLTRLPRWQKATDCDAATQSAVRELADRLRAAFPRGWAVETYRNTISFNREKEVCFLRPLYNAAPGEPDSFTMELPYSMQFRLGPKATADQYRRMLLEDKADRQEIERRRGRLKGFGGKSDSYIAHTPDEQQRLDEYRAAQHDWRHLPDMYFDDHAVFIADDGRTCGWPTDKDFIEEQRGIYRKMWEIMRFAPAGRPKDLEYLKTNADTLWLRLRLLPGGRIYDPETGRDEPHDERMLQLFAAKQYEGRKTAADTLTLSPERTEGLIDSLGRTGVLDRAIDEACFAALNSEVDHQAPQVEIEIRTEVRSWKVRLPWTGKPSEPLRAIRAAVDGRAAEELDKMFAWAEQCSVKPKQPRK